jgi:arsenical pump membrane protein
MTAAIALTALAALLVVVAVGVSPPLELGVALGGAGLVLATGALPWSVAADTLRDLGPTLGFLASVFVIAEVTATAGIFDAAGTAIERQGRSARSLVVAIALAAAVITALLSLDTTAVLFTPVVISVVQRRRRVANAALVASAQMTNASSSLLPVSNLTNLLVFPVTGLSFAGYALRMALPTITAAAVVIGVCAPRSVSEHVAGSRPTTANPPLDRFGVGVVTCIGVVLLGFLISSTVGVEPVWFAAAGAVVLGGAALATRRLTLRRALAAPAPGFLLFVAALVLVVAAAEEHGLADAVDHLIPGGSGFFALAGIAILAAVLANLINNLPATLVLLTALPGGAVPQLLAVLIGVNVLPNVTYTGSLATLLWRREVRRADVEPPRRVYYRLGFAATPAALAASVTALWLTLRVV